MYPNAFKLNNGPQEWKKKRLLRSVGISLPRFRTPWHLPTFPARNAPFRGSGQGQAPKPTTPGPTVPGQSQNGQSISAMWGSLSAIICLRSVRMSRPSFAGHRPEMVFLVCVVVQRCATCATNFFFTICLFCRLPVSFFPLHFGPSPRFPLKCGCGGVRPGDTK